MPHATLVGDLAALGAALSWAIGVILFRRAGRDFPPLSLNLFKGTVATLLMTATVPLLGGTLVPDVPLRVWGLLVVSGLLGISLSDTLYFHSLDRIGAGLAAVVATSYAPGLLVLSYTLLGERLETSDLVGGALIVSAVLATSGARPLPGRSRRDTVVGVAYGVLASLTSGASVVLIKPDLDTLPVLWTSWVRLVAGAAGLLPVILLSRDRLALLRPLAPSAAWRIALPAGAIGSYLAVALWLAGMKFDDVSRAALLNQMSTVFIFVLAVVALGEPLSRRRLAAVALAVAGAALVLL